MAGGRSSGTLCWHGVSSAEFYTWNWAKDKDGVATTNGTQLVNYDGQENLTFVAAGATIALKMWSADYTRLEHLSIRADHIGIGRGAVATALEPTVIIGNAADETLDAARSSDTYIIGGKGDDFITGGSGNDRLFGGQLQGDAKSSEINTLSGLDGNDLIVGAGGVDIIDGGKGVDTILGGYGNDRILGGEGEDLIHGDVLFSGKSNLDGIDNLAGEKIGTEFSVKTAPIFLLGETSLTFTMCLCGFITLNGTMAYKMC